MLDSRCHSDEELVENYFFPGSEVAERGITSYCNTCPTKIDCLEWAIANNEPYGVWGGTTTRERERIRSYLRARLAEKAEQGFAPSDGFEASNSVRFLLVDYINNKLEQGRPKRSRSKTKASH